MGDLQEVDLREAAADQLRIDALLDVAGKEEPVPAGFAEEHDRNVVDRGPAVGRVFRHPARVGPEDAKPDPIESELVARRQPTSRWSTPGQGRGPGLVAGTRPDRARLVHTTDPVAREQRRQAGDVVLVRVREHQEVDPAVPWRQPLVEGDEEASRIGSTVHDEPSATAALDEDPVALPDVEDDDPNDPVGPMGEGDGQRQRGSGERDRGETRSPGLTNALSAPVRPCMAPRGGAQRARDGFP
jgi:hypothetical protein